MDSSQNDQPPSEPRALFSRLVWPLLSLLSLLVFELTAQPALTAVVLCSKFGWENLLTGLWLRRTDPNAGRGVACFWFSLMLGVFKILMVTCGLTIVIVAVVVFSANAGLVGPGGPQQPSSWIRALFGVICVAELLLMSFGLTGCVVARRYHVKVWISPMLHRARRAGQWPPGEPSDADRTNSGDHALMPAIAIAVIAIAFCAMLLILEHGLPAGPTIIMALTTAVVVMWLSRAVTASTFEECWPESTLSEPASD